MVNTLKPVLSKFEVDNCSYWTGTVYVYFSKLIYIKYYTTI